jgi:hypothetical protein
VKRILVRGLILVKAEADKHYAHVEEMARTTAASDSVLRRLWSEAALDLGKPVPTIELGK